MNSNSCIKYSYKNTILIGKNIVYTAAREMSETPSIDRIYAKKYVYHDMGIYETIRLRFLQNMFSYNMVVGSISYLI